jgi:hypothetical protein
LIEEAIGKLLNCIGDKGEGCEVLGDALEPWKTIEVIELLRKISVKVRDVDSAVEYFASNYGEKFTSALEVFNNECWKRAAFIIGHALAGNSVMLSNKLFESLFEFLPENLTTLIKSVSETFGSALSRLGDVGDRILSILTTSLTKYFSSGVESFFSALNRCGVDDYLLVDDEIPPLVMNLIENHVHVLTEAFVDKYNEIIAEIKRVLNVVKNRSNIYEDEVLYSLGLVSIIANAAGLGKYIEPSDADAALHIVSSVIQHVPLTKSALRVLAPLRDKAPQRYLEVLALAVNKVSTQGMMCLGWDAVMYILNEFDYILNKYGDGVKGHAWTLIYAINASINLLYKCLERCDDYWSEHMDASFRTELEHMVSRVAGLLDKINRLNPSLGIIAWSRALLPALKNKCVRALMESVLGIDVVNKAKEVARELNGLKGSVQELARDQVFMSFVKSWLAEADEMAAKRVIPEETSILKHTLAQYKLVNDELDEAERLFNEAAKESREIGDYMNYLDNRNLALRTEAIKGPLAGDDLVKLVNGFRQLYEEAVNTERLKPASPFDSTVEALLEVILRNMLGEYFTLSKNIENILRDILGGYLVSLALMGGDEEIRKIEELLKEQWKGPEGYLRAPILTKLTLSTLLSPRVGLGGELRDRLVVKPAEIIVALGLGFIDINSLPALKATNGTIKPGDEKRLCKELTDDPIIRFLCGLNVLIAYLKKLSQQEEGNLRQALIDYFQRWISKGEVLDLLKKLGLDAESLNDEFRRLIHELSGRSLLVDRFSLCFENKQLDCSSAHLIYMLYALINGNEKLAKAHTLAGAMISTGKLPARLFLEAYRACCDPNNEEFRRAVAKLFFYHV